MAGVPPRAVALLSSLICAVTLASCGGGSPGPSVSATAPSVAPAPVDRLTLPQQVGQVLIAAFGGTSAPAYLRRALAEGRVAGVILFRGNLASPAQLRTLTRSLQRAAGNGALVMADQEGGEVRIVPWARPERPQAGLGTPAAVGAAAAGAARDLRAAGVNVTLAPVADVARPGSALAARTFPGGARAVSASVRAAVSAYRAGRVGATVKHFPGLGAAGANTDDASTRVRVGAADLAPFRAAVEAGTPLVMVSHALYPQLDRARIASQSRTIVSELLRRRLRFRGVAVTDSIEARAVLDRSSIEVAAQRALEAGVDLVLMTGDGSLRPISRALLRRARRDAGFRTRVREAAARVLALKRSLGLSPPAPP